MFSDPPSGEGIRGEPSKVRRDLLASITNEGAMRWRLEVYGETVALLGTVTAARDRAEEMFGEPVRWTRDGDRYVAWSH